MGPHGHRALSPEIADADDVRELVLNGGRGPVVETRQSLADGTTISRGLVPAHPSDRELRLPFSKSAELPARGSAAAGPVDEPRHRFFVWNFPPVLDERLRPIIFAIVTTGVDELPEFLIRDLVLVEPIVFELDRREPRPHERAARDADHRLGPRALGLEGESLRERHERPCSKRRPFERHEPLPGDLPFQERVGDAHSRKRRLAKPHP